MLSEILAEVQKNSPIGQKRPSLNLTPKLDPMVRKKRRKTMINLPSIEQSEKVTKSVDDISLRYITNGIMEKKKKTTQNKKDEIDEEIEEKENKSHVILERWEIVFLGLCLYFFLRDLKNKSPKKGVYSLV